MSEPMEHAVEAKGRLYQVEPSPVTKRGTTSHVLLGRTSTEYCLPLVFKKRTRPDKGWTHVSEARLSRIPIVSTNKG